MSSTAAGEDPPAPPDVSADARDRDAADLFDAALTLEEDHIEEGYQEGMRAGRSAGRLEGRALGLRKGYEVGAELGYYSGCAQVWRQLEAKAPGVLTARADKAVAALEQSLRDFPLGNPQDERLQELMDSVRGRYKAAAAMVGLQEQRTSPGDAFLAGSTGTGGLEF